MAVFSKPDLMAPRVQITSASVSAPCTLEALGFHFWGEGGR